MCNVPVPNPNGYYVAFSFKALEVLCYHQPINQPVSTIPRYGRYARQIIDMPYVRNEPNPCSHLKRDRSLLGEKRWQGTEQRTQALPRNCGVYLPCIHMSSSSYSSSVMHLAGA